MASATDRIPSSSSAQNPGYLLRSMHLLPRQGANEPWRHTQDYWADRDTIPNADLADGTLVFD
jgi:hypothetical protein